MVVEVGCGVGEVVVEEVVVSGLKITSKQHPTRAENDRANLANQEDSHHESTQKINNSLSQWLALDRLDGLVGAFAGEETGL